MSSVIENVMTGLRSIGYKVAITPQEKIGEKEVVITIEDIEIEVETSTSYFVRNTLALNWYSDNIINITAAIPAIIKAVEKTAVPTARDFKFQSPSIVREGTAYTITLKFEYTETV